MRDHALREQRGEGFGHVDLAHMRQCAGPEPGVEQVQDRVFNPADILFDRQPFGDLVPVERLVGGLAGEAQEIPRTVDESVERVGLAFRLPAACGAIDMFPSGMAQQRIAGGPEIDILGQRDRQAVLGRGDHAAFLAMDEGDRRAPVPLARHTPVAQPPHGLAAAASLFLDARDDCALGVLDVHPVEKVRIDQHALARLGLAVEGLVRLIGAGRDDPGDRQSVFGGEFEIALVVARYRHDRAGAVIHQHEVRDIDRQVCAGERVLGGDPGIETQLLGGFEFGRRGAALLAFGDEGAGLVAVDRLRDRMVGGNCDEARPEDRVGPRGIDRQRVAIRQIESEFEPLGLADPVFLHQPDLVGPVLEAAEPFEQLFGEIGDLEEPLVQLALLDLGAAAPALPVDHLFIGEHGHVDRVPIDLAFLAIDEARFVEIDEQRLLVPVVIGFAGRQLARPVKREAEALQLRLHVFDIVAGPAARVDALFHRRIFGGHAEGVPAHRVQHLVPHRLLVARQHVAHRVIAHMADMDAPRRIGEHLEHVALGLGGSAIRAESLRLFPRALPVRIGAGGIETGFAAHASGVYGFCGLWEGAFRAAPPAIS